MIFNFFGQRFIRLLTSLLELSMIEEKTINSSVGLDLIFWNSY